MLAELLALARKTLAHKPWRKLITSLLTDEEIAAALRAAPAAKGMHHAYAGGLLEHTLSVCRLCLRIAEHYPQLDRQALFAGAVCHDLGKLWELTPGLAIDYTTPGRLIGHISLMLEHLAPFIKKSGLEPELAEHLQHLILSHHGALEFGSPKLPATAEAMALHYADNMDAKLQQIETALAGLEEGVGGWSAYYPPLERFLFRAMRTPGELLRPPANGVGQNSAPAPQPLPLLSQCSLLLKE
jgi:3'-5' exoribonuclease